MSSITRAIAQYNFSEGQQILRKYKQRPAIDVSDMIVKLDYVGSQWSDSHLMFAGAHPDADFFSTLINKSKGYSNCSGGCGMACDGSEQCGACAKKDAKSNDSPAANTPKDSEPFYKKNQNVLIIALAIVLAAAILKN